MKCKVSRIEEPYETESNGLDDAWAEQKKWFGPGVRVLIEDEQGNHKIFVKGEKT